MYFCIRPFCFQNVSKKLQFYLGSNGFYILCNKIFFCKNKKFTKFRLKKQVYSIILFLKFEENQETYSKIQFLIEKLIKIEIFVCIFLSLSCKCIFYVMIMLPPKRATPFLLIFCFPDAEHFGTFCKQNVRKMFTNAFLHRKT